MILETIFSVLILLAFFQLFIGIVSYRFGIKIPMKDKPPKYKLICRYFDTKYRVHKTEYIYQNLVVGDTIWSLLWLLVPLSPLFRVKRYVQSDDIFNGFTREEIKNLPDDFCLGTHYETQYQQAVERNNKHLKKENKFEQKLERLNNNQC